MTRRIMVIDRTEEGLLVVDLLAVYDNQALRVGAYTDTLEVVGTDFALTCVSSHTLDAVHVAEVLADAKLEVKEVHSVLQTLALGEEHTHDFAAFGEVDAVNLVADKLLPVGGIAALDGEGSLGFGGGV